MKYQPFSHTAQNLHNIVAIIFNIVAMLQHCCCNFCAVAYTKEKNRILPYGFKTLLSQSLPLLRIALIITDLAMHS